MFGQTVTNQETPRDRQDEILPIHVVYNSFLTSSDAYCWIVIQWTCFLIEEGSYTEYCHNNHWYWNIIDKYIENLVSQNKNVTSD